MNSSALGLGLVGVLTGFVGAAVAVVTFTDRTPTATERVAAAGPQVSADDTRTEEERKLAARAAMLSDSDAATFAELNRRIELLETEISALRAERAREAVATEADVAKLAPTPEAVAEIQREAIVQVLEDQKRAEAEKREAERKERQRKAADEQAARAAKELGLGAGDERRLSDFIVAAGDKRDEMFRPMREGGNFDRDAMRQSFDDYRTWAEGEINSAFGASVGGRILEYQRTQRDSFGGFGGFGGGPPGGPGSPQGGGASGRSNRGGSSGGTGGG
jgi:uncharacterized small protein (DUF1192 family)